MINLIIADGSELTRIGLRTIFMNSRITIAKEVASSVELMHALEEVAADIVLIDYTSDGFSLDVVLKTVSSNKKTKFVGITSLQLGESLAKALKSGIYSHVKKDCSIEEIMDAVEHTYSGNKFFCGEILETIQKEDIKIKQIEGLSFSCESITISEREIEIITLIAEGFTNIEISERLFISKHTVNTHRKNIMAKIGVKNTAGIVMYAVRENYITPNKFSFFPKKDEK
ncbi:MAG: response regulator transcription factor [Putridiphycobacter sp.]|nr:response regulator transcription factor [Putridiphycobacter sp.]